jgi:quercetin dioxygenase-like cupin family protein
MLDDDDRVAEVAQALQRGKQPVIIARVEADRRFVATLVLEGSVEMTIDGEPAVLGSGEWSVVASGVEHGITASGDGARIVAIIAPPRASSDDYEVTS